LGAFPTARSGRALNRAYSVPSKPEERSDGSFFLLALYDSPKTSKGIFGSIIPVPAKKSRKSLRTRSYTGATSKKILSYNLRKMDHQGLFSYPVFPAKRNEKRIFLLGTEVLSKNFGWLSKADRGAERKNECNE